MKLSKTMARNRTDRHSVLICSIVIAICSASVITSVQCSSVAAADQQPTAKQSPAVSIEPVEVVGKQQNVEAKSASAEQAKPSEPSSAAKLAQEASIAAEQTRKGRSDAPPTPVSNEPAAKSTASQAANESGKSATASSKPVASKSSAASSSSSSHSKQQQLTGKSGSSSSSSSSSLSSASAKKLPANLGTVTSTGSGGPAHYMSKHDAYSAIAEKHGALAQDAMRKADKRNHNLQRFSGIQKASGFTDTLNPFKTVTDGGLARNIGASMRSIMKGKYSIPAYVASAVLGAVALMAFYESPISPLPVPALPEPPVGRFPPEMPVISPNLQVPFRMNQQQQQQYGQQYGQQNGYGNQRSFQTGGSMTPQGQQQQQPQPQQQQVLFPGASAQTAQQRAGSAPGPVQQLAANLISSVSPSRQTAQRKSGTDQEPASSRSFFGSSSQLNTNKLSAPANQHHKQSGGNSLLSFLGFGGSSSSGSNQVGASSSSAQSPSVSSLSPSTPLGGGLADVHRASGLNSHSMSSGTSHDSLAASLSNSHLVNKMKSYFDRPVPHNSWSMDHNVPNQYDQYRRMSIMQALAKDTAFLSSFFSPSRRSSNSTSSATNSIQQSINAVLASATGGGGSQSGAPAATQQVASSRMQVDTVPVLPSLISGPFGSMQPAASQPTSGGKRASSGYGLMKAADRVAHALLDTFTSGLLHRSSESASTKKAAAALEEQQQQNALASATSILSDIMSNYNAAQQASVEMNNLANQQQAHSNSQQASSESGHKHQAEQGSAVSGEQVSGRSADSGSQADKPSAEQQQVAAQQAPQQVAKVQPPSQSSSAVPEQHQAGSQQQLTRKVRSIGLEYPTEQIYQQQQQPSRASQINNLVDFVSDSYKQNKLLFSFVMNQVGLSQALPYVEQFLGNPNEFKDRS